MSKEGPFILYSIYIGMSYISLEFIRLDLLLFYIFFGCALRVGKSKLDQFFFHFEYKLIWLGFFF